MGPPANNSDKSTSRSSFFFCRSYYRAYWKEAGEAPEQQAEAAPPPDSQASAALPPWQNGRFLCLCLFLSPAVTPRRVATVSASGAGGQRLPPSQPRSLSPSDLAARGRQGGELGQRESRRPGSGQDRSHLAGGRRGRGESARLPLARAHVHLLWSSGGIPGCLVNTLRVNTRSVLHTEIRGIFFFFSCF